MKTALRTVPGPQRGLCKLLFSRNPEHHISVLPLAIVIISR